MTNNDKLNLMYQNAKKLFEKDISININLTIELSEIFDTTELVSLMLKNNNTDAYNVLRQALEFKINNQVPKSTWYEINIIED